MALVPFAGAGIWAVAGALVRMAASKTFQLGVAGSVISDFLNIDWLNQEALKISAPGSDPQGVREAANQAARMLGLDGSQVLWPRRRDGTPIFPKYFFVDLTTGRAWVGDTYNSAGYVRKLRRSGRRSFSRWGGRYRRPAGGTMIRNG